MKALTRYIYENNEESIKSLRDFIIDKIKDIDNEEFLDKLKHNVEGYNPSYKEFKELINKFLTERGCIPKPVKSIVQKIKYYGCSQDMTKIINAIDEDNSEKYDYITDEKFINGNNIFTLVNNFIRSISSDDISKYFIEFIKDIANCNIPNNTSMGAFEYLSLLFFHNISGRNKAGEHGLGDINTEKYGYEYKVESARITGSKNTDKPLSAKIISDTFRKLVNDILKTDKKETDTEAKRDTESSSTLRSDKDLDTELDTAEHESNIEEFKKELNNTVDIFHHYKVILKFIDKLIELKVSDTDINKIIIKSFLSQVPNVPSDNDTVEELLKYCNPVKDSSISHSKNNNSDINKIKNLFLAVNLYNYKKTENFDYLVLFKKDMSGDYKCLDFKGEPSFDKIYSYINNYIKCTSLPSFETKGATQRNEAPAIFLK